MGAYRRAGAFLITLLDGFDKEELMPNRGMKGSSRRRRQNSTRVWVVGGIVAVAVIAALIMIITNNSSNASTVAGPPPPAALDKCGSAACGQPNAPVTLDVYSDFQCPYCKQFHPTLEQLAKDYVDTGKVKIVFHPFPVIGAESDSAAQAAYCAGDQNQFWHYANDLFAHQGAENSGALSNGNLKKMAADLGLNTNDFNSCFDSGKYSGQVNQSKAEGNRLGVKATPTFFVNGKMTEGAVPYDQVVALINAAAQK